MNSLFVILCCVNYVCTSFKSGVTTLPSVLWKCQMLLLGFCFSQLLVNNYAWSHINSPEHTNQNMASIHCWFFLIFFLHNFESLSSVHLSYWLCVSQRADSVVADTTSTMDLFHTGPREEWYVAKPRCYVFFEADSFCGPDLVHGSSLFLSDFLHLYASCFCCCWVRITNKQRWELGGMCRVVKSHCIQSLAFGHGSLTECREEKSIWIVLLANVNLV